MTNHHSSITTAKRAALPLFLCLYTNNQKILLFRVILAVYFDIPAEGYGTFMTTAEISDKLVIKGSIKKPMSMVQLGMLLRKRGFQSKQVGPSRTRGWLVRERDSEEVNANRNIEGRTP